MGRVPRRLGALVGEIDAAELVDRQPRRVAHTPGHDVQVAATGQDAEDCARRLAECGRRNARDVAVAKRLERHRLGRGRRPDAGQGIFRLKTITQQLDRRIRQIAGVGMFADPAFLPVIQADDAAVSGCAQSEIESAVQAHDHVGNAVIPLRGQACLKREMAAVITE